MEDKKKSNGHGGARPNAGRPKGSTDKVTIASLLDAVTATSGQNYVELLAEDFIHARANDRNLAQKYHNLILNKVAATLSSVEVKDDTDQVAQKALVFAEALAELAGKKLK